MKESIVYKRQKPLIEEYKKNPEKAWIVDYARVIGTNFEKPMHTSLIMNDETKDKIDVGIHRAVGGYHDIANPGDILCGALASCFETTLRMIADRLSIQLTHTDIVAKAYADVRGTLQVDRSVTVGFQKMSLEISLTTEDTVQPYAISSLIKASEYSCVVYQTLKAAIPIEMKVETKILNMSNH
jgi:uncharacterized OsmC-like protein